MTLFENGEVLFSGQVEWKGVGVKSLSFTNLGGSVSWTNGTLYVNGTAYAISLGSQGSPLGKLITVVLDSSTYTGTVYFRTSTYVVDSNAEMQIGFCDDIGNLRMRYGIPVTSNGVAGFGGDGSDGAFNSTGSITISGVKNYTSFKINAGHTIVVDPYAIIKCTGNFEIAATGILESNNLIDNSSGWATAGIGVLANAPIAIRGTGSTRTVLGAGSGLGIGAQDSVCYAGNGTIGLNIIKKQRGWFCGGSAISDGKGGGAILIECLGTVTIAGTISCQGGYSASASGGGGGCVGILSVGNVNCSGGTINVKGGDSDEGSGTSYDAGGGGGGAFVVVTEGTYTMGSVNVSGGTHLYDPGGAGGSSITSSASPGFCRIPWVLG